MAAPAGLQWIEIDTSRLAANLSAFRRHLPVGTALAPVVKGNAYGHGIELAAPAFVKGGAQWFCVHAWTEARRVLALDLGRPVLILGPLADEEVEPAVAAGAHCTVYDAERIASLQAAARRMGTIARVHLKLETGTWRQGVSPKAMGECLTYLRDCDRVELTGLHSHYANIEDTTDHGYADAQHDAFTEAVQRAADAGFTPPLVHMSCSAAGILFPRRRMDLARIGISAYGFWPSAATRVSAAQGGGAGLDLAPALTWKCRVAQVKTAPAGSYIGYGCSDKVEVDTRLAVLPVGYYDGYDRSFSGRAHVLIHGRRCPVRGRVCMNLVMADVSHVPAVAVGDEAVLLGRQGDEELRAETLADWAGTIHYEIVTRLGAHLPRLAV
jgi:alanine racemase